MARQLRIEYPGAVYHVMSRGNEHRRTFLDDDDRLTFLETLATVNSRYNWFVHAYCLMGNHYHVLIETPDANLSVGMQQLNGVYAQRFNAKRRRVGHLFQGRFKAIIVERESYLLELCRYIVLNPVRADMVDDVAKYPWSSYGATAGLTARPACLATEWLHSQFSPNRLRAMKLYQRFVNEGLTAAAPFTHIKHQLFLGSDDFVRRVAPLLDVHETITEFPRTQRFANRTPLAALFKPSDMKDRTRRNQAILRAHLEHGYKLIEIADHVGLHYSMISKILAHSRFKM